MMIALFEKFKHDTYRSVIRKFKPGKVRKYNIQKGKEKITKGTKAVLGTIGTGSAIKIGKTITESYSPEKEKIFKLLISDKYRMPEQTAHEMLTTMSDSTIQSFLNDGSEISRKHKFIMLATVLYNDKYKESDEKFFGRKLTG
jgi:hypothetical protein